ncbi:hypothetical protein P8452_41161 [Trifolium repens]|nr:hypothetical protein P8452_41161 [Trifolium repens]
MIIMKWKPCMNSLLLTSFNSYTLVLLLSECADQLISNRPNDFSGYLAKASWDEIFSTLVIFLLKASPGNTKVNSAVRNLIRNNSIVYGGGSTEIACSVAVEEATNIYPEVEQKLDLGLAEFLKPLMIK